MNTFAPIYTFKTNCCNFSHALLEKFYGFLGKAITKYHPVYLGIVCLFAFIGYFFVLLFPLLIIISIINIYETLIASGDINWQSIAIWSAILLFSTLISYRSIQVKPTPAVGLKMPETKVPRMYEIVQKLQDHFRRPTIHRIIITANYELDIIKTPKWVLPVWSTNTLVIGLPVLLCLTPTQFEFMVARRIGQFSKQTNPVTNWLYQLRGVWPQYSHAYGKQKGLESKLLKWFYNVYASLYKTVSVYAARTDEMNADKYTMELYNDADVNKMITADAVCRLYLQQRYWPAVSKIAAVKTKTAMTPFRKLTASIRASLVGEKLKPILDETFDMVPAWKDPMPSLRVRLDNIGHDSAHMLENKGDSAAEYYLGSSLNGAINLMDKLWLKNNKQHKRLSVTGLFNFFK